MNDGLYMTFIACLPRKRVGRLIGAAAGWIGQGPFTRFLMDLFVARYRLNMDEAELPLASYPNLSALFTRKLKPGARPIDGDPLSVVSPVDGIMAESGPIVGSTCTQVKGRTYSVDELLGGAAQGAAYHGGYFVTLYLSPRHYHRIHSPVEGRVTRLQHLPGQLWPVNPPSVRTVDRLFAVNERMTSYVSPAGHNVPPVAVVKVGAIGVGRISVAYADRLSNRPGQTPLDIPIEPPYPVERGGELGTFHLGSTVVLIFPPNLFQPALPPVGSEVRLGERIGAFFVR